MSKPVSKQAQDEEKERKRQSRIVWRDFSFLVLGGIAASIMGYIELHSSEAELRGGDTADSDSRCGLVDTGYIVTTPIHDFLEQNRDWNDVFAFINTVIGVFGPGIYMVYQTLYVGDYEPIFRYGAISALRSFCGWFTYLPPDPSYLMSNYDFPDIIQCLTKDCGDPAIAEVNPFVSFFSGHVATLVLCANHMYLHGNRPLSIFFHIFDVFQIVRLLATRGHYSIDIIIGFYMAAYVSNPAGRIGRHYSRGNKYLSDFVPATAEEAFEQITGVAGLRNEARVSKIMKSNPKIREAILKPTDDHDLYDHEKEALPETTARLAAEGKLYSLKLD